MSQVIQEAEFHSVEPGFLQGIETIPRYHPKLTEPGPVPTRVEDAGRVSEMGFLLWAVGWEPKGPLQG